MLYRPRLTDLERAQLLLELLAIQEPGRFDKALTLLRGATGKISMMNHPLAEEIRSESAGQHAVLFNEIQNHLAAMQINSHSSEANHFAGEVLESLHLA